MFTSKRRHFWKACVLGAAALAAVACTVHPAGEREARQAARVEGKPYKRPFEKREVPQLPADATPEQMVQHALLTNAEVEAKYWDWRAMVEQVPQAGTQKSGVELSFETMITNGNSALEDTTLAIGNDAMNALMLPGKLGSEAAVALREAQAAGLRFDRSRYVLRNKVLGTYYDYALAAELVRLEEANTRLLELSAKVTESRLSTGTATQVEMLKAGNAAELSRNEAAMQKSKLAPARAMINALLNRPADAPLDVPATLPAASTVAMEDDVLLQRVAANNPELKALAAEVAGKKEAITRAKLEYLPDFNVNFSSDLAGMTQTLMGSVVIPYLRHEALEAGVKQAVARMRAAEAIQRQAAHELNARVIGDLAMLRDAQRQVELLDRTLVPRAQQIVTASQNAYASGVPGAGGGGSGGMGGGMGGGEAARGGGTPGLLDLLDSQRSLITLQRMRAELQIEQARQLADLEEVAAGPLGK